MAHILPRRKASQTAAPFTDAPCVKYEYRRAVAAPFGNLPDATVTTAYL
jgi:hypothetical protein